MDESVNESDMDTVAFNYLNSELKTVDKLHRSGNLRAFGIVLK